MSGGRQRPDQWFSFGPWAFSIDEAEQLIADRPREPVGLDVVAWASAYGLTQLDDPNPSTVDLLGPAPSGLNREYAMGTDLTKPGMVASWKPTA